MRRLTALRLAVILSCAIGVEHASAQINREKWNAYSAQEFSEAAAEVLKSPELTGDDRLFVSKVAWNRFLVDESFVRSGDLRVVQSLVKQFAPLRNAAVDATVSAAQVEMQLATLQEQLIQRLRVNKAELGSIALHDLKDLVRSIDMPGFSSTAKAELFIDWMKSADWRSLALADRYSLYSFINLDAVDRHHFSARWTGSLRATTGGSYLLRQLPQYSGPNTGVKVYIGEEVVLDSTDEARGESRLESRRIDLTANKPLPIRVEIVQDVSRISWSEGAPMVVLTWEADRVPQQIIPSAAFAPPEGFGGRDVHGLKGEYFAGLGHQDLQVTRLDAALDMISSWPPAVALYHDEADAVIRTCVDEMLNDGVIAEAVAEKDKAFFHHSMWRIAYRMSATDRVKLVETLLRNPEAIALITPESMGRLMQAVYMLPGKEHLTLLGEWASTRPQPRTRPGEISNSGNESYREMNIAPYERMGRFLQGPYWPDVESLWDEYLTRDGGECNLAIAYATAYATQEQAKNSDGRHIRVLFDRIKEHLDDDSSVGDARISWLLAWNYANENTLTGTPRLLAVPDHLTEARLVAESPEYQFWALQETAVRLVSLGDAEGLDKLMEDYPAASTEQKEALAAWRRKTKDLQAAYARRAVDAERRSNDSFAAELERRLAKSKRQENHRDSTR